MTDTALFSTLEAQQFDRGQIGDKGIDPTAIAAAERRIRSRFYRLCGVAFVSTSASITRDGTGTRELLIPYLELTAVTACTVYDEYLAVYETFDADDLADLAIDPAGIIIRRTRGTFLRGLRNVSLAITHGMDTVPEEIKWAALKLALWELIPNDVDQRATAVTVDGRTWSMATAGRAGYYTGIPEVDEVLKEHDRRVPGIG